MRRTVKLFFHLFFLHRAETVFQSAFAALLGRAQRLATEPTGQAACTALLQLPTTIVAAWLELELPSGWRPWLASRSWFSTSMRDLILLLLFSRLVMNFSASLVAGTTNLLVVFRSIQVEVVTQRSLTKP
jgi:hypothetical protein